MVLREYDEAAHINNEKLPKETIIQKLVTRYELSPERAEECFKKATNPIFPIELSCGKLLLFLTGVLWIFFIYIGYTDFEGFLEIHPISLAMIAFLSYGTVSVWKLVHTEISAEQDGFIVKSGKQKKTKYPYSAVTQLAYTDSRYGTTYSIYVGNKKVVVFDTEFKNCNQFVEVLKSNDIVFDTYCKLLWKRIRCKLKRK